MITKGVTGAGEWMISIGGGDKIRVYAKDDSNNAKDFTSSTALTVGTWSMITVIINRTSDKVDVYKDNGSVDAGTSAGWTSEFTSVKPLRIGVNSSTLGFFNGQIDEVRIYNRALTTTEITKNYKHGKAKHS